MSNIFTNIILIFNSSTPFILGFVGIFVCAFKIPSYLFDNVEMRQIDDMYYLRPITNVTVSNNQLSYNSTTFPLLGKYNGIKGGHRYKGCQFTFSGTCYDDFISGREIYCPSNPNKIKLIYELCENNTNIPETNYTIYKSKYLYAEKTKEDIRYETLLSNSISENELCPENQKKCGYLNEGLAICYNINEPCPINDIIFDNSPNHIEGNINYTSLKINDNEYLHYTNEKTDNQIVFDLLMSIEHPASKIETLEEDYTNIYQLHDLETEMYYIGSIDKIKVFKQIYNTNLTYEDIAKSYNMYDSIINDQNYKKSSLKSNMFIYKKNPIPFSKYTRTEILDFNDNYHTAYILNYVCCGFLFATLFLLIPFFILGKKIYWYIGLTLFHGLLITFFGLSIKALSNNEILKENLNSFEDKNYHRIQLLIFHSFYFGFAIFQNLSSLILYCLGALTEGECEVSTSDESVRQHYY